MAKKKGAGRPTKYKESYNARAEKCCKFGGTDEDLAALFGVAVSTISLWKNEHEQFSEALKKGKYFFDTDRVENSFLQRALGQFYDEEVRFYDADGNLTGKKVTRKYIPPDTGAGIFWMKNRRPRRWRDSQPEPGNGISRAQAEALKTLVIMGD